MKRIMFELKSNLKLMKLVFSFDDLLKKKEEVVGRNFWPSLLNTLKNF